MSNVTPVAHGTRRRAREVHAEETEEAHVEATRVRRRVGPRTPVVHDVPFNLRIKIGQTIEGLKAGNTKQHLSYRGRDVDYENFCSLPGFEETLRENLPRGSWDLERTGDVFERTKSGQPKTRLSNSGDWDNLRQEFQFLTSTTGKAHEIRINYHYKPSATPSIASCVVEITSWHKCPKCTAGFCYLPFLDGPHLAVSHSSILEWALDIKNNRATKYKPPTTLAECVKWKKMLEKPTPGGGSEAHKGASPASPAVVIFQNSPGASAIGMMQFGGRNGVQHPPSSPPPEMMADDYIMLADWFNFTWKKHSSLPDTPTRLLKELKKHSLGYRAVKHFLKQKDRKEWEHLEIYGMNLGMAWALSKELFTWEATIKDGTCPCLSVELKERS